MSITYILTDVVKKKLNSSIIEFMKEIDSKIIDPVSIEELIHNIINTNQPEYQYRIDVIKTNDGYDAIIFNQHERHRAMFNRYYRIL